jgi:CRP-like cAMP-binding protein
MKLDEAIRALAAAPADLQARANLASALQDLNVPEAASVWRATARAAGGRGQFFVALALARRFLDGPALDEVLAELARRYGAGRPRHGPLYIAPPVPPRQVDVPADPEEQAWLGVRLGADVEDLLFPKFARMPPTPIFEDLPADEFVALAREVQPVALDDGAPLMTQDAVERAVFVLVRGNVKAVTRRPDGSEIDLGVHAGPTVLGEMALLTQTPRRASVVAQGPGLAWRMDADRVVALGQNQPALVQRLRSLVKQRLLGDLLRTSRVLAGVERLDALLHAFVVRTLPPGTQLFEQDAPPPGLFFVLYGAAEVWADGTRVAQLGEGDAFGEMSLLTGRPTTAAVRMPDGGIVLHLPSEAWASLRGGVPALEQQLGDLADVRRGGLVQVTGAAPADADAEPVDERWALDGFGAR